MHKPLYALDLLFLSELPGFDPTYTCVYFNSWSSYEESGWRAIAEKDSQYYRFRGGYSVMAEGEQDDIWEPEPISEDEALEDMFEWDKFAEEEF